MITTAVTTMIKTSEKKDIKIKVTTTNKPSTDAILNTASYLKTLC
jgi:hypothetical protein